MTTNRIEVPASKEVVAAWQSQFEPEPIEEGWLTTRQIAKVVGRAESTMRHMLATGVRDGKYERPTVSVSGPKGLCRTSVYRVIEKIKLKRRGKNARSA